jgi:hypothetical protein
LLGVQAVYLWLSPRCCWKTKREQGKIKAEAEMCLKIQSSWPMPTEMERIRRKLLKENDGYWLIEDRLFEQLNEEEYADLYSVEGKPGPSAIILTFISVIQFMEKLVDQIQEMGLIKEQGK